MSSDKLRQPEPLRRRWLKANRLNTAGEPEKRCAQCKAWFLATVAHFHKKGARLCSMCRECANKEARTYQRARYVPRGSPRAAVRDLETALRGLGR